jgi:hypothetical protein
MCWEWHIYIYKTENYFTARTDLQAYHLKCLQYEIFKIKFVQLKFTEDIITLLYTVTLHYNYNHSLAQQLQLQRHQNRTAHRCANPLKQRLTDVTSFRISKSLYFRVLLFKRATILVLFLQIVRIVQFTRPNSRHTSALSFPFPISHIALTFLRRPKPSFCSSL